MIRNACIAATLATSALLPVQSASAAVTINSRVDQIINALTYDAVYNARDFSLSIRRNGPQEMVFKGIEGIRGFNDYAMLNNWVAGYTPPSSVFTGGSYKFTHSVLGSFFTETPATPQSAESAAAPGVFEGAPYKFTHSVLDSYFDVTPEQKVSAQAAVEEPIVQMMMMAPAPVPEPATWAMMIGGFALIGASLRARRIALRTA